MKNKSILLQAGIYVPYSTHMIHHYSAFKELEQHPTYVNHNGIVASRMIWFSNQYVSTTLNQDIPEAKLLDYILNHKGWFTHVEYCKAENYFSLQQYSDNNVSMVEFLHHISRIISPINHVVMKDCTELHLMQYEVSWRVYVRSKLDPVQYCLNPIITEESIILEVGASIENLKAGLFDLLHTPKFRKGRFKFFRKLIWNFKDQEDLFHNKRSVELINDFSNSRFIISACAPDLFSLFDLYNIFELCSISINYIKEKEVETHIENYKLVWYVYYIEMRR